jgi:NADP-dependent 3-hydroxy acid dehydrogenase YdfG
MLLGNKNAVIYGAGGATAGAVARALAREGAKIFLTGRRLQALDALARDIVRAGGSAETAIVDALDERGVEEHVGAIIERAGSIDISYNAIGIPQPGIQGIPLTELSADCFSLPVVTYVRSKA